MMFFKLALGLVSISAIHIGLSGFAPVSAASSDVYNPHQYATMDCSQPGSCDLVSSRTLELQASTTQKIPEPGMVTAIILSGLGILSTQKRRAVVED